MMKLNNFMKKFINENKSLISDIFFGMNTTSIQCSSCKMINYDFDIYYFLSFPLEEIKEYKMNQLKDQLFLMNNMVNMDSRQNLLNLDFTINSLSIYDCFQYKKDNIETFAGPYEMKCCNCNANLMYSTQTNLCTAPEILIIGLNKGKDFEINIKLNFSEDLNLMNFIEMNNTGYNFKLIGVISYIGKDGENKKFCSYCRNPIDSKWYKFEDKLVKPVVNFQNEIVDSESPYILFYRKIK